MIRFLAYLAGLPSRFLPALNPYGRPKSIDIDMGWPTSLAGGERPGGEESGCQGA